MTNQTRPATRRLMGAALLAGFCTFAPSALRAQGDAHEMSEVETIPRFSSPSAASRLIAKSYPEQLKRAGISGSVQLEFIVSASGRVEPGSVQIVAATVPALGEAAKAIAEKIEFTPGTIKGEPVRTKVVLPLSYKAT
jgi:TonB family protein